MKHLSIFYSLFVVLLISITSCTNDKCADVVCGLNKKCVDGNCVCIDGFTGSNCTDTVTTVGFCDTAVCGPNKQCALDKCYCADGYEGSTCTDEAYLKYVRSWLVQETCQGVQPNTPPNTTSNIFSGTQINRIVISNFLGQGLDIIALIKTDQANLGNTLEVPRQNIGGVTVEGFGTYNTPQAGQISFEFTYTYGGVPYSCQQRFYPQ